METTIIKANLPPKLTSQAHAYVKEDWAAGFDELLADALQRFLESHSGKTTEAFVMEDVEWGLHGKD